jgi:CHAT domain-containing protein
MTRRLRMQPNELGLAERVRLFRFPMERRLNTEGKLGVREHQRVGRLLAETLLPGAAREALREAGVRRLAIVPDGILHHVPFSALILAQGSDPSTPPRYQGCRYLVHDYAVAVIPSATALAALRERAAARRAEASSARRALLAFADPVFTAADPRAREAPGGACLAPPKARSDSDQRLPATAHEAHAVAELFPGSEIYLGWAATKGNLQAAEPRRFRYLLFATHAHVEEEHPLLSYVRLTATGGDGGFLQAREIFELELDADLVTLSACQSGLGKLDRGEGIVGLATAFFAAGAHSVLASLWKIVDQPTAALVPRLHARLREGGVSRADALREAQLEMIAQFPEYAHPFYWAFTLLGDWRDDPRGAGSPGGILPGAFR